MITLAQLSPTDAPKDIAIWLACLFFIVLLYNEGRKAFRRLPPNEQLGADHSALEQRTARNEHSIRELYKRNEEAGKGLARLESETRLQNQHLMNIEAKLDRLIERKSH